MPPTVIEEGVRASETVGSDAACALAADSRLTVIRSEAISTPFGRWRTAVLGYMERLLAVG
jgi:hypothetical protein